MISFCLDNIQLTKCDEFEELKSLEGIEFKKGGNQIKTSQRNI